MICGRNATQGLATVARIPASGGRASFSLTDVAVAADVQAAIDETIATYGRLDIVFNNAGGNYPQDGPFLEVSEAVWDRIVEATLKGTFLCCQYALPFLQQADGGTIINFIELPAAAPTRSVAAVCRGGILAITSAIAQQFSHRNVAANLIWVASSDSVAPSDSELRPDISPDMSATTAPASSAVGDLAFVAERILYSPLASDSAEARPFADVAEAVMYLATCDRDLQGFVLLVNPPAE